MLLGTSRARDCTGSIPDISTICKKGLDKTMCPFSGEKCYVSDYNVIVKQAECPRCGRKVKISIPDPYMHENVAKFSRHKAYDK